MLKQILKFLIMFFVALGTLKVSGQKVGSTNQKFQKAWELRITDSETSLEILTNCFEEYMVLKDTTSAIKTLRRLAFINGHHAKYKESYDYLWKALSLASDGRDEDLVASIYVDIGRYYGFYKRKEEAFGFVNKSLNIKKRLIEEKKAEESILLESYYAMVNLHREFLDFDKASLYLDSCYAVRKLPEIPIQTANLEFEKAVILTNDGKIKEAITLFEKVKNAFAELSPEYNVLVEAHKGLAYQKNGQLEKAERSFEMALDISEMYDSHRDFANLIHEYLSTIYFLKGNMAMAYVGLKKVKELDKQFFDSRSENNRALLEIQDQFRVEQERAEAAEQKQKLRELEAAEEILFLQRTILIIALIFILALAYLYVKYLSNKHKAEKRLAKKNQELEIQKANELIEIKNREMAVSSIKLIEKEEIIDEFKSGLEKVNWKIEPAKLKRALKSLEVNHNQNWEEFETRFSAINSKFYENLHEDFPDLTSGDDKLCALVKLNFNSKEMAKLLGISIESVHTSRYRLRKKLGLERDDNLTDFISKY